MQDIKSLIFCDSCFQKLFSQCPHSRASPEIPTKHPYVRFKQISSEQSEPKSFNTVSTSQLISKAPSVFVLVVWAFVASTVPHNCPPAKDAQILQSSHVWYKVNLLQLWLKKGKRKKVTMTERFSVVRLKVMTAFFFVCPTSQDPRQRKLNKNFTCRGEGFFFGPRRESSPLAAGRFWRGK